MYNVAPVYQPTRNSCWAVSTAILLHWHEKFKMPMFEKSLSLSENVIGDIASMLMFMSKSRDSYRFRDLFSADLEREKTSTGNRTDDVGILKWADAHKHFTNGFDLRMVRYSSANLKHDYIFNLLKTYGPCILCYDDDETPKRGNRLNYSGHCVVLIGIAIEDDVVKYVIWDPGKGIIKITEESLKKRCNQHNERMGAGLKAGFVYDPNPLAH